MYYDIKDGYIPRDFLQILDNTQFDDERKQDDDGSSNPYDGMVQIYVIYYCIHYV